MEALILQEKQLRLADTKCLALGFQLMCDELTIFFQECEALNLEIKKQLSFTFKSTQTKRLIGLSLVPTILYLVRLDTLSTVLNN